MDGASCEPASGAVSPRDGERAKDAVQQRLNTLLANSMLRERFIDKTFENFLPLGRTGKAAPRPVHRARFCRRISSPSPVGDMASLHGQRGHRQEPSLCRHYQRGHSLRLHGVLYQGPRLLREVKDPFHRDSEISQSEIIARMGEIDLLVIDEVGIQFGTDTERMISLRDPRPALRGHAARDPHDEHHRP